MRFRNSFLGALAGAMGGGAPATWTDIEMCMGCKSLMELVLRETGKTSSVRDIMFTIHSACNDQPEVLTQACMHATHYDAQLAVLRQTTDDLNDICSKGGMCSDASGGNALDMFKKLM
jgi:hypothetical protein